MNDELKEVELEIFDDIRSEITNFISDEIYDRLESPHTYLKKYDIVSDELEDKISQDITEFCRTIEDSINVAIDQIYYNLTTNN